MVFVCVYMGGGGAANRGGFIAQPNWDSDRKLISRKR